MTRGGVIESPHPTSFVNQVQKTKETGVYRGGTRRSARLWRGYIGARQIHQGRGDMCPVALGGCETGQTVGGRSCLQRKTST